MYKVYDVLYDVLQARVIPWALAEMVLCVWLFRANAFPLDISQMSKTGWPMAIGIAGSAILTELTALYGERTGNDTFAFPYIALHYGILPVLCLAHVAVNTRAAWTDPRAVKPRLIDAASSTVSLAYLGLLFCRPLPIFGLAW